jgi:hypothetical protein
VLGGKVVKGQQAVSILRQASRRFVVLGPVFRDEAIEGLFCILPFLGLVDRVQILFGFGLQGRWQLVEHVRGFVDPASLLPGPGPDLVQRLPETKGAVAGGELGVKGEAVLVA